MQQKCKMFFKRFVFVILPVFLVACSATETAIPLAKDKDPAIVAQEKHFITKVAPKYDLQPKEVKEALNKATFQPKIIQLITTPAEKKTWGQYRKLLVTPARIQAGQIFLKGNAASFKQEEKTYHVPASVIAAIIGVETYYGKNKGSFKVIDALSTLAFGYPKRAEFFQKELAEYLVLVKKNNWDIDAVKGSYSGAFGLSQFMPSSYRRFAVNHVGNQKTPAPNLHLPDHAIMSIGNYLKENGWQPGGLIAVPVQVTPHICDKLKCNQRKPNYTVETWLKHGVVTNHALPKHQKASLILLDGEKGQEAWLIFKNFYVITTYNISINYAMAVFQVSRGIQPVEA